MIKYFLFLFLFIKTISSIRYNGGPIIYGNPQMSMGYNQNPYLYSQIALSQYQRNPYIGTNMNYSPYQTQMLSPYINTGGLINSYGGYSPYMSSYGSQLFNTHSYLPTSTYNVGTPSIATLPYVSTYGSSNLFGYTNSGLSTTTGLTGASLLNNNAATLSSYPSYTSPYITSYPYKKI
uniref:Uncharacterized protein n=1 Tax=Parastrongyloides trichosuri TaxID=131310 RepID=A0A0N4ZA44_PARTI